MLPERFFAPAAQARLAGTEWADPHNPEEWQRHAKNEDNVADYQSVHDRVMANQDHKLAKRWSKTHQLIHQYAHWWKGTRPVIAGDNDLKRGVIQLFHDNPAAGHPGIQNTYTLTKRDFWWPNMKQDIEEYVKGYSTCQESKINTRPLKPAMIPITPKHSLPLSRTKVLVRDGPIQRHLLQGKQAQDASLRSPSGIGPDGPREIHAVTL